MAQYKGFIFDGINSADYGVVITGASTYSAPERAVELYDIPGRNGALAIDQGRFANIEIMYHCAMADRNQATFAQRLSALRNQLCSRYSYVRLTDDYNADEYRLALYKSGLDADLVIDRGGEFDVVFDCKPQRFLTSGESTYQIGEWGQTITQTGDIVTYQGDDLTAVKSLTTDMEPIQDLHGYANPWPAGGGKNKYPILIGEDTGFASNSGGSWTTDGESLIVTTAAQVGSGVYSRGSRMATTMAGLSGTYTVGFDIKADKVCTFMTGVEGILTPTFNVTTEWTRKSYTVNLTGNTVTLDFYSGDNLGAVVQIKNVQIESGSTSTAWEPYSNICPIYGRTGQTVTVCGKNIFNEATADWVTGYFITSTGQISQNDTYKYTNGYTRIEPETTYTVQINKGTSQQLAVTVPFYDINKNFISRSSAVPSTTSTGVVSGAVTTPVGAAYCRLSAPSGNTSNVEIELGSTATAYEPYAGTTYTRSFVDGQGNTLTVYGGEDEIVGGVLTLTKKIVDLGSLTWAYNGTSGHEIFHTSSAFTDAKAPSSSSAMPNIICSLYKTAIYSNVYNHRVEGAISIFTNGYIYVVDSRYNNYIDFKAAMNGVQLCYELAEPETHQLTPQEVATLIGTNHVWSDAGEVTVEYGTDPYTMVNDTPFASRPLIKVTGYGEVGFGDITITITGTAGVVTYIDCDLMECYRMSGGAIVPANQYVTFTGPDFPTIPTGKTRVTSASTISKVEVVPRWWII